jgi:raffinose/stachyose/melibiose transport system permease protein
MNSSSRLTPYLYVMPLLVLLAFVFGYPLVRIFEFSFKMVRGINGPWIGLRNYELVLSQNLFWEAVLHNLQLLLASFSLSGLPAGGSTASFCLYPSCSRFRLLRW